MRYYIIAGEASGDLHASNLMRELKAADPAAEFRFWGGDLMQSQGGILVKHYKELAFMGFAEVVMNIRTILRNLRFCKQDIMNYAPDAVILVDYPGFNLRIAEFAHGIGLRTVYYVSPQAWAWKESRVETIKRVVDRMLVILPFEVDFYKRHDYPVEFVGHPLLDALSNSPTASTDSMPDDKPVIALLPGSRKQEILAKLPVMLSVVPRFPDYRFVIAAAPSQDMAFYRSLLKGHDVDIVQGNTYGLLRHSRAALVTSGTATLETALLKVPQVVCYRANRISYMIARALVKIRFISLVNLIMDREVVRELIQNDLSTDRLEVELRTILSDAGRDAQLKEYEELQVRLGGPGASRKAANSILRLLRPSKG